MKYIKISDDYIKTVEKDRMVTCSCDNRWAEAGLWRLHFHGVSCPGCGGTVKYKKLLEFLKLEFLKKGGE